MTFSKAFAYFWLVGQRRHYFLCGFAITVGLAVFMEWSDAGSSEIATVLVLIIQMFAVSNGFASPASRGFYDPVLTRSASRASVAAAHLAALALPGWIAWALIAVVEALRAGSPSVIALKPAAILGLILVSVLTWAANLPFVAFSAAGLWFAIGMLAFVSGRWLLWIAPAARSQNWSANHPGRALLVALLFPFMTPGLPASPMTLFALAAIAVMALAAGILFIHRRDFPLAEES